jgi:glycosyltransferase involved in cell wall biosynthesis
VLDAVIETRKSLPETRFAAIPDGPVDPAQLDAVERRALALGHHGIIEWTVGDNERSFWYACATVVCAPALQAAPSAAPLYAAAAGRPFVTNDPVAGALGLRNNTGGYVVDTDDASTLNAAVAALVADTDEAQRLGEQGRSWAEQNLTEAGCLAELGRLWHQANPDRFGTEPSGLGLAHAERAHA